MAVTTKFLRRLQLGQEVTKGTPVAATVVALCDTFQADLKPSIYVANQDTGLLTTRHEGIIVGNHIMWSAETDTSYEQLIYWLNTTLKKVTVPTGAMADKTWTFTPSVSGADDFMTFTMETRHSDGTNNIDREYDYCIGQGLEISGALDGPTKLRVNGFAQSETTAAITGALAVPSSFIIPAAQNWKLFSDANFAALGTTQITGQLYGFSWKLDTGLLPAFYMDGTLNMTRHKRRQRSVELTLTLDQEASSGLAETFRTRLTSRALSYIQLETLGAVLGAGNYKIELDGAYLVTEVSPPGEHDGEDMVTVKLRSTYDVTGAQDIRSIVVNAAATLV